MNDNEIDDAGPAFPVKHLDSELYYPGLTIRDWFAGQALQGLIAQSQGTALHSEHKVGAEFAYGIADAMIKERNKHSVIKFAEPLDGNEPNDNRDD